MISRHLRNQIHQAASAIAFDAPEGTNADLMDVILNGAFNHLFDEEAKTEIREIIDEEGYDRLIEGADEAVKIR